jgi:hypothetical protein
MLLVWIDLADLGIIRSRLICRVWTDLADLGISIWRSICRVWTDLAGLGIRSRLICRVWTDLDGLKFSRNFFFQKNLAKIFQRLIWMEIIIDLGLQDDFG